MSFTRNLALVWDSILAAPSAVSQMHAHKMYSERDGMNERTREATLISLHDADPEPEGKGGRLFELEDKRYHKRRPEYFFGLHVSRSFWVTV